MDFEKERKLKKRNALDYTKFIKKHIANKHIELAKQKKKEKLDLVKKANNISKQVSMYWKKIEKIVKYEYSIQLKEEQMHIKQNRLIGFINKLQKISARVASSLTGDENPDNNSLALTESNTNYNNNSSTNSTTNDCCIVLKKINENSYSLIDTSDENVVANAAHNAQQFQPVGFDLAHCKVTLQAPFLIKFPLREYQLIGLNWLSALHDNKINGILADEMGLGKTIQTIALIAHLACNKGIWGPHLIIVPTTIIINWEIEFKKWCPSLKILSYYGNQKERKAKRAGWHKPNAFNVCITSYKLVIQDFANFKRKRWYYVILDEAQNIKNFKSKRWQMILNFKAKRKLLLSGTPLQNDVMEIWSYLHFLMPHLFYSNEEFRDWFYSQFKEAVDKNSALNKKLLNSLHSILRPFLLRRLKKDVEKQLPAKKEHIIKCELTRRQKYLYDEYINSNKTQDTLQQSDYFSIMNVLMQLKKVCNHPDLFEARDYITPTRLIHKIEYQVPSLIVDLFAYHPLVSMNYKNLGLNILENEKHSLIDYLSFLKNFPQRKISKIYKEMHQNKIKLSNPHFNINENDILFKQNYVDSTILYNSNTENSINPSALFKGEENLFNGILKNVYIPKYLCPTNIPLLKDNSLLNFFDIFYPSHNDDSYLDSYFQENINKIKERKFSHKLEVLKQYDKISRESLINSKPIYGSSFFKMAKIFLPYENVFNGKNIVFGSKKLNLIKGNISNSSIFNKFIESSFDKEIFLNNTVNEGIEVNDDEAEITNEKDNKIKIVVNEELFNENENKDNNKIIINKEDRSSSVDDRKENGNESKMLIDDQNNKSDLHDNNENKENKDNNAIISNIQNENNGQNEDNLINNNTQNNFTINVEEDNATNISTPKKSKIINLKSNKLVAFKKGDQTLIKLEKELNQRERDNHTMKNLNNIGDFNNNSTNNNTASYKYSFSLSDFTAEDTPFFINSEAIQDMILNPQKLLNKCKTTMDYFNIHVPKIISSGVKLVSSKHITNYYQTNKKYQTMYNNLLRIPNVQKFFSIFKTISFPDRKLVEYDSGKLVKLSGVLKNLRRNKSKCLIFTQMTKMLDILEIFLNIHGYTYVRLDGSTKVESRQAIVERFNNDSKIFCFISSTRSGGIGLNLTGADSIIFYDTDWNPAMDKQAQDRCHRIGQTRTVNIYRLITSKTIEENIFKKSIQKRELSHIVMEHGQFDIDTLKENKIDFKNVVIEEGLIKRDYVNQKEEENSKQKTIKDKPRNLMDFENLNFENEEDKKNLEAMLIRIEDQEDVQAYKHASMEMLATYERENNEQRFLKLEEDVRVILIIVYFNVIIYIGAR